MGQGALLSVGCLALLSHPPPRCQEELAPPLALAPSPEGPRGKGVRERAEPSRQPRLICVRQKWGCGGGLGIEYAWELEVD